MFGNLGNLGKDVDAKVVLDLKKATITQLNDIYDRQSKLVKNKKCLQVLPDKGAKVIKFLEEVEIALAKAKERELATKELLEKKVPVLSEGFTEDVYENVQKLSISDNSTTEPSLSDDQASEPPMEQESASKPSLEHESASEPPMEQESASKPSLEHESASEPPMEQESASEPPMEQESASEPPMEQESASKPSLEHESASEPPMEQESASKPSLEHESASEPPIMEQEQASELAVVNESVLETPTSSVDAAQTMDTFTTPKPDNEKENKIPGQPHIFMHYSKSLHDQADNPRRKFKTNEPLLRSSVLTAPSPVQSPFKYFEALAPPSTTKTAILLTLQDSLELLNNQTNSQTRLEYAAAEKCLKTWSHVMHGEATPSSGVKNLGVTFRVPVADLDTDEEEDLLTDEESRITEESEEEGETEGDTKNAEFLARLVNASVDLS